MSTWINDLAKDTSRYLSYLWLSIRAAIEPTQKCFFDAGIRTHNIEDGKVFNEALLNPSPSESMAWKYSNLYLKSTTKTMTSTTTTTTMTMTSTTTMTMTSTKKVFYSTIFFNKSILSMAVKRRTISCRKLSSRRVASRAFSIATSNTSGFLAAVTLSVTIAEQKASHISVTGLIDL